MIKYISEDSLLEIKSNVQTLYNEVIDGKKKTLEEAFGDDRIIRDTNIAGDDFDLDMSFEKPEQSDLENVKRVHKHMSALSESQASDERIWAAYTLSVFQKYMEYRWKPDSDVAMMNRYFFSYSPKRSLFRNGIEGGLSKTLEDTLKQEIREEYGESIPGTALNKCKKFCFEVKEGDIALISDRGKIAFAEIGEYYEEENPEYTVEYEKIIHDDIRKARFGVDSFECPYIKRRKIKVLKILNEAAGDIVSPYLFKAIAVNRHSLSDLTEHAETILSSCFDVFTYENKTTLTVKVTKEDDVDAIAFSTFVINVARLLSIDGYKKVAVKSAIHSPGEVIFQIEEVIENNVPLIMTYLSIFGGKINNYELNSITGFVKSVINYKYDKTKKELELDYKRAEIRKVNAEADLTEQQAIAQRIENEDKERQRQLALVDEIVPEIVNRSRELKVEAGSNIIDITDILNRTKYEENE